jgi:hypothetical protein
MIPLADRTEVTPVGRLPSGQVQLSLRQYHSLKLPLMRVVSLLPQRIAP